jgi:dTDP-glucose 4,6-dehydratase
LKILVTGGLGFIGSALIRKSLSCGYSVLNIDAMTYAACEKNLQSVHKNKNYFFNRIDIRDKDKLKNSFEKYQPDIVMHLAAESHVDRSITNPSDFIETNVMGTFNMLEISLNYWKKFNKKRSFRFHHISTDEVFGSLSLNSEDLFTEETPYNPRSPYSASKASSDHLVRAWHETYDLPAIVTNCSNNYGPYQFPEKLIPLIILNALEQKPLPIYGDGSNVRDWLYVDDHVDALLQVAHKGKIGRTYNIGGNNEFSNLELVKTICSILDKYRPRKKGLYEDLIKFVQDRPGHDARYAINSNRIKNELGWKPSTTIMEGLEKTIVWYIENEDWWKSIVKRQSLDDGFARKNI